MHSLHRFEILCRVKRFSGGSVEGSERFSKVSLGDYRGTKRIARIFGGCMAFHGGLIEVPNG